MSITSTPERVNTTTSDRSAIARTVLRAAATLATLLALVWVVAGA